MRQNKTYILQLKEWAKGLKIIKDVKKTYQFGKWASQKDKSKGQN